ncbi:MAG TPA: TldD/PmbA family protein [Candidatus Goldiibacteriota bacterium]|nr:TldD/PmbA family protein [Candidatus Goldiibacteriota bacterium]HRQ44260.1 TldD/PmbA family protein [Candidatus Goldiibacteriota bacterium]
MSRIDNSATGRMAGAGFDIWDIFLEKSESLSISFEDNRVDKVQSGSDEGIGLRGTKNGRTFYGFTNNISSAKSVADTITGAARANADFTYSELKPLILNPVKIMPDTVSAAVKTALLKEVNDIIRSNNPEIRQVNASYLEKIQDVEIINNNGVLVRDRRVYTSFIIFVIAARGGRIETAHAVISGHAGFEVLEKSAVISRAKDAAGLAVSMLDTDRKIAGEMPVVLSSTAGGTMIHEAVGHSLEADLVQKDMSEYKGRMGQKVSSPLITVIDDATLTNKRGSFSFDDEGTPAQKTVLIENGILKNFMYDRETAAKDNTQSTGNGRRESYRFRPIPRMRNTMIAPGTGRPDALLKDTKSGIFVKRMGGGQVNTVTGEFIFEVKEGYLIENGEVTVPVRNATLMGKGVDVINSIDAVCDDIGFDVGTCGKDGQGVPVSDAQPTLRIPRLLVGSK